MRIIENLHPGIPIRAHSFHLHTVKPVHGVDVGQGLFLLALYYFDSWSPFPHHMLFRTKPIKIKIRMLCQIQPDFATFRQQMGCMLSHEFFVSLETVFVCVGAYLVQIIQLPITFRINRRIIPSIRPWSEFLLRDFFPISWAYYGWLFASYSAYRRLLPIDHLLKLDRHGYRHLVHILRLIQQKLILPSNKLNLLLSFHLQSILLLGLSVVGSENWLAYVVKLVHFSARHRSLHLTTHRYYGDVHNVLILRCRRPLFSHSPGTQDRPFLLSRYSLNIAIFLVCLRSFSLAIKRLFQMRNIFARTCFVELFQDVVIRRRLGSRWTFRVVSHLLIAVA